MLSIYTKQKSERLNYILAELFGRRIGVDFIVTNDESEFNKIGSAKINYSDLFFADVININPSSLLFEEKISQQNIQVKSHIDWNTIFFETDSEIPFDIFAASFYLLSRYEEYQLDRQADLPNRKDKHGRFLQEQSLAFRNHFIETPLVDVWAKKLKELILEKFPQTKIREKQFRILSTIDIDFAYKYKGIGLIRQKLKFWNALFHGRLKDCVEQIKFNFGSINDPYDTYDFIQKISQQYKTTLIYFVLMRTGTKYDKNISPDGDVMKRLLQKITEKHKMGLHPSYFSDERSIGKEKYLLEKQLNKKVIKSRQHFLKFSLPETYQALENLNFSDDYSMAYSSICGFRASTCLPFLFYNLKNNTTSSLTIHSPIVMDVTLKNYEQLSIDDAIIKIEKLMREVKNVNGDFISIWHNSNLTEQSDWKNWNAVFEKMHTLAVIYSA